MPKAKVGTFDLERRLARLEEVSWSFEGSQSRSPMSGVHFHPARFISQLPAILISRLSDPGDLVLDPFCGSGTTLLEAQRLGRRSFGCDINPVSVTLSKAKTAPFTALRAREILTDTMRAAARADRGCRETIPETVQTAKWYSPHVATTLAAIHNDIRCTGADDARLLKTFCFSSILLKVCRETRHWGFVCDNTTPKDDPERKVLDILDRTISEIVLSFEDREVPVAEAIVVESSASRVSDHLADDSVDLVVTSPPYEGVVDYVKSQRLTLEWMGLDVERLRARETGARSKRHRIKADTEFVSELKDSFNTIHRVLRPGAPCAVVFGVSSHRAFTFDRLLQVMDEVGFDLRADHLREVAVRRRMKPSLLNERLFVFTKRVNETA